MDRPFEESDDGKLFVDNTNGRVGRLEFPLLDPGQHSNEIAILWYTRTTPSTEPHWVYVSPSKVNEIHRNLGGTRQPSPDGE